jgi:tetratricopeptide (TPR) repeat protein
VSDDIRTLTARLAEEPTSLAFLELGEALRRRGQLEAAHKIARGGLARYPGLADAHDLLARILADQGDLAGAFDAWADALRLDPMGTGALKGIAFLYFRAGDAAAAIEHLQRAAEADPDDPSVAQALARVRRESRGMAQRPMERRSEPPADAPVSTPVAAAPAPTAPHAGPPPQAPPAESGPASPFSEMEGDQSLVLVDAKGLMLAGSLPAPDGSDAGDRVAAHLAGVSREAARTTRLLGLGSWQSIAIECADANFVLVRPTGDTVLLAMRESSLPTARVGLVAERAARAAKRWLERVQ